MPPLTVTNDLPLAIIVEDEKELAAALSIVLTRAGYLVETIQNGRDALNQLRFVTPYLLLLDLNLPFVSGSEILDSILQIPEYKDTKIFITSANTGLAKLYADKADLIIEKPFRFKQMEDLAARYHPAASNAQAPVGFRQEPIKPSYYL